MAAQLPRGEGAALSRQTTGTAGAKEMLKTVPSYRESL